MLNNNLNGISIINATNIFTAKSPKAKVNHGIPVPKNEIEKNRKVSTTEPIIDETNGAMNHFFFLNLSKICTSNNCANMNAVPEPIAIRIEIKSPKFVEKINVNKIPIEKPK